jgi:hypothetical protein
MQVVVLNSVTSNDYATQIVNRVQKCGYDVPWDRDAGGMERDDGSARCYIVLWTIDAATSRWVWNAAVAAHERGRLIEVIVHDVDSPFDSAEKPIDFRHTDDKEKMRAAWKELIRRVEDMTGEPLGTLSLKKQFEPVAAVAGLGGIVASIMMMAGANLQPTSDSFVAQQAAYDTHELEPVALGGPVASPAVLAPTDTFTPVEITRLDTIPLTIMRIESEVSTVDLDAVQADDSTPPA